MPIPNQPPFPPATLDNETKALRDLLADAARKGAALGDCGRMCHDCAFHPKDDDVNMYAYAVQAAADSLAHYGQFNCHTAEYTDAGVVCKGFLYAKQYFDHLEKELR